MVIEYKTAKLAKKVGFDTAYEFYDLEGNLQPFGMVGGWSKCNTKNYAAPTQSDLQKWLREKHRMFVFPEILDYRTLFFSVTIFKDGNEEDWILLDSGKLSFKKDKSYKIFVSYEEALEEGLYKALEILNERKDTAGNT